MEEFKAKRHAVKKMTRKGLVETDSREGIVKETAEAKSDGRRIDEADFQLELPIPCIRNGKRSITVYRHWKRQIRNKKRKYSKKLMSVCYVPIRNPEL